MSSSGFTGVLVNGELKTSYNHMDSAPSELGTDVTKFIKAVVDLGMIEKYKELANVLKLVNQHVVPEPEDRELYGRYSDSSVADGSNWYATLRKLQGDIAAQLEAGVAVDSQEFYNDSVFCEYGYLVNFDYSTLEVFRGFQKYSHDNGRFAANTPPRDNGYYPVALIAEFSFADIAASEGNLVENYLDDPDDPDFDSRNSYLSLS